MRHGCCERDFSGAHCGKRSSCGNKPVAWKLPIRITAFAAGFSHRSDLSRYCGVRNRRTRSGQGLYEPRAAKCLMHRSVRFPQEAAVHLR